MTAATRPPVSPERLVRLMSASIAATGLDASGLTVLTEAATGAYAVTPVIAAMAGAETVLAVTRPSRHGSVADVAQQTRQLAERAGVADRVTVLAEPPAGRLDCHLVTNSGHLRPIDRALIERLPRHAVIALMYEAWECRAGDIDLAAARARGIPVAGVNEHHPAVDVFSFLGPLAVKLLHDAGVPVYRSRIAVFCDNAFGPPIETVLRALGAEVVEVVTLADSAALPDGPWDALLWAMQPGRGDDPDAQAVAGLAERAPGAIVAQMWGDLDRALLSSAGLTVWPPVAPAPGHMAVMLSDIGPEPIVRLQTGGLRAAECVLRHGIHVNDPIVQLV
jgi:hypothetical protein